MHQKKVTQSTPAKDREETRRTEREVAHADEEGCEERCSAGAPRWSQLCSRFRLRKLRVTNRLLADPLVEAPRGVERDLGGQGATLLEVCRLDPFAVQP